MLFPEASLLNWKEGSVLAASACSLRRSVSGCLSQERIEKHSASNSPTVDPRRELRSTSINAKKRLFLLHMTAGKKKTTILYSGMHEGFKIVFSPGFGLYLCQNKKKMNVHFFFHSVISHPLRQ